jgi:hypothetical protein
MGTRAWSWLPLLCLASAPAAAGDAVPGRVVTLSAGGSLNPSFGHATAAPPPLLRELPELQLGWGLRLGGQALLTTRLDLVGAIVPIGPAGAGLDVAVTWAPGLGATGWRPIARASVGGFVFASGGEGLGRDYTGAGFRLAAELGLLRGARRGTVMVRYGVVAGVQAIGLPDVSPCGPGDDCSDALIGPSLRLETMMMF